MRLIDADSLYDALGDKLTWLIGYGDDVYLTVGSDIRDTIDNQPTAYDIDKVVEELKCDRCESCSLLEICAGSKYCGECHKKIIEIVKQGGVYDDVCEWHCDEYGRWHTECHYLADNDPLEYTFCPYCGKKIKVVE